MFAVRRLASERSLRRSFAAAPRAIRERTRPRALRPFEPWKQSAKRARNWASIFPSDAISWSDIEATFRGFVVKQYSTRRVVSFWTPVKRDKLSFTPQFTNNRPRKRRCPARHCPAIHLAAKKGSDPNSAKHPSGRFGYWGLTPFSLSAIYGTVPSARDVHQ